MILMTPEEAAEEFGIARRTLAYWVEEGKITAHPRDDNDRPHGGGHPGYRVERAAVKARVAKMRPRKNSRRPPLVIE